MIATDTTNLVKDWLRKTDSDLTDAGYALIELCAQRDASFFSTKALSQELTPYAVELRYDAEFWPALETTAQALGGAMTIRDFVVQ